MMLSTKGSSTDRCFNSSTVFGGATGSEPIVETLKQLKTLIVDVDLLEDLEKDFIYGYSIKTMLKKLDVSDAPVEVVDFLVTFGPLFDQIHADFQRMHNARTKMEPQDNKRSKAWNLESESDQHAKELKERLHQEESVVAALDAQIADWTKEIKALQKKVHDAETKKNNLWRISQI